MPLVILKFLFYQNCAVWFGLCRVFVIWAVIEPQCEKLFKMPVNGGTWHAQNFGPEITEYFLIIRK